MWKNTVKGAFAICLVAALSLSSLAGAKTCYLRAEELTSDNAETGVNVSTEGDAVQESGVSDDEIYGAEIFTEGDWRYTLENGCTIVGYKGNAENVVIPDTLDGFDVKVIFNDVFNGNQTIKTLVMGSKITSVGSTCFAHCDNLESITFSPKLKSLGWQAFAYCKSLKKLNMPASLCSSDASVWNPFENDDNIQSISFAKGCTYIPRTMFQYLGGLRSVTIPDTVKTIGRGAFEGNGSLTTVNMGRGVKVVEQRAFYGCSSLESVTFSPTLTSLEGGSFWGCTALKKVELPKGLFSADTKNKGCPFKNCYNITSVEIEKGSKYIFEHAFEEMTGLKKVVIPDSVTEIGYGAFYGCTNISEIKFGKGLKTIGGSAFENVKRLKKLEIPGNVINVYGAAFYNCDNLLTVKTGYNLKTIGMNAFASCDGLTKIEIHSEDVNIYGGNGPAFNNCPNLTIYGYKGSTAEAHANKYNIPFVAMKATTVVMYRMYNKNSGEHFYTSNKKEIADLESAGWANEGQAWRAPVKSKTPVYRLYNANAGDHHYTTSASEKNNLVKAGWKYEGIGWYSDDNKGVALYRLYNPNAKAGSHHYTVSASEKNSLMKAAWKYEGIAWYGVK